MTKQRHEQEIRNLETAYRSTTTDLKEKLRDLITTIIQIKMNYCNQTMYLDIRYLFSPLLDQFLSPYAKKELYWHIAKNLVDRIEKEVMLKERTFK